MARLFNDRREKYSRNLAAGMKQVDAYLDAGYTSVSTSAASRLANDPRIVRRIVELKAEARNKIVPAAFEPSMLTRDYIMLELYKNAVEARDAGDLGVSNKALEALAKVGGFIADHRGLRPGSAVLKDLLPHGHAGKAQTVPAIAGLIDELDRSAGDGAEAEPAVDEGPIVDLDETDVNE